MVDLLRPISRQLAAYGHFGLELKIHLAVKKPLKPPPYAPLPVCKHRYGLYSHIERCGFLIAANAACKPVWALIWAL
ncbi:hypothetical protein LVJ82_10245 [Vitreoscilla massiliensis]|uniref:Transposase n=1 Tax=Vitreoscilla massiliensis TaxID=1689272 RepID=A0ABY4DX33_9NEIS|nr:hypothetical protein [Vitreoscilla massiliensis]UOO87872.1 hypothetical protein LVJ82_10245 [Vitreoscilla massiliensis]